MARYTAKAARERGERFETSWQENSPDKEWAGGTLLDFKAKRKRAADLDNEILAIEARQKALLIQREDINEEIMQECDYIAAAVEGDRNYGPDSALYGGFGYIRKSERKKKGSKKKTE